MSMKKPVKRDPDKPAATPTSTDPSRRGGSGGDYRRIATATGPAATKGTYTPAADPGEKPAEDGSPADFYAQQHGSDDEADGSK
ncbi:hypothetical protein OG211_16175 [Streptomyces niveus]|uniref:hypothetical protein n=1 Tax=Streptomyces niveus TaxID=193462 RepID=UPI003443A628|nr:hypothetical protein OG211_16175 [Streptomyces niveus]